MMDSEFALAGSEMTPFSISLMIWGLNEVDILQKLVWRIILANLLSTFNLSIKVLKSPAGYLYQNARTYLCV